MPRAIPTVTGLVPSHTPVKISIWFDNKWAYANRMLDVLIMLGFVVLSAYSEGWILGGMCIILPARYAETLKKDICSCTYICPWMKKPPTQR